MRTRYRAYRQTQRVFASAFLSNSEAQRLYSRESR